MNSITNVFKLTPDGRLGRVLLHARCLWHDHKYQWHLAGIWREVTLH